MEGISLNENAEKVYLFSREFEDPRCQIISATIMGPFSLLFTTRVSDYSFQPMRSRATALHLPELGVLAQS
jgi:hypothetical protein